MIVLHSNLSRFYVCRACQGIEVIHYGGPNIERINVTYHNKKEKKTQVKCLSSTRRLHDAAQNIFPLHDHQKRQTQTYSCMTVFTTVLYLNPLPIPTFSCVCQRCRQRCDASSRARNARESLDLVTLCPFPAVYAAV